MTQLSAPLTNAFSSPPSAASTVQSTFFITDTSTQLHSFFSNFGLDTSSSTTSQSTSTSSPNARALINKTKDIIYNQSGFYSNYDSDVFSEDFVFRGPYIGPLNKQDYLDTMDAFRIYEAIPDINPNAWGYSIDPNNPNRVWFMVRNTGTFNGKALLPNSLNVQPNGEEIKGCPETFSILYDEEQKLKYLSVGYVADRFEGNTQGKGAAVGIFNAIGLSFPPPGPLLRLAQFLGTEVFTNLGPKSFSKKESIPDWWTDDTIGCDGYL